MGCAVASLVVRLSVGHCLLFASKTLDSHSACFHPGAQMGTGELAINCYPIQEGVEIIAVISRDLLRHDGPLGSYADFTINVLFSLLVQVMQWKSKMRIIIRTPTST